MRIKSVHIQNLRCIKDQVVTFDNYTCLVGPNGSGKSTVLCALNIFFRESENTATSMTSLTDEDFHKKNTADPIRITVTFTDLSPEAQIDFADYYRQGELTVLAEAKYDSSSRRAEVLQYGIRKGMADFMPFFEALGDGKKVGELKEVYADLQKKHPELQSGTKEFMTTSLRDYEAARPQECIPIQSADQFYGATKGQNRLQRYVQWVYVPAVKDAASEQIESRNSALGKLLLRAVSAKTALFESVEKLRDETRKSYGALLDKHKGALDDVTKSLQSRISEWAHPNATIRLQWRDETSKSIRVDDPLAEIIAGEHGFEGELARFGHGMQRSYLLALLHEISISDPKTAPTLILGCEEPELYQHPPQARYLASVLTKLTEGNSQVMITSHSPLFVSGASFEDVRVARRDKDTQTTSISSTTLEELSETLHKATGEKLLKPEGLLAQIHQVLQPQLNEMFFTPHILFVEGVEDAAYLNAYLTLSGRLTEFRSQNIHIIPVNKKSEMIRPLLIANALKIPAFIVFDADADDKDPRHERDNKALLALSGNDQANPKPTETYWGKNAVMWHTQIDAAIESDITDVDAWKKAKDQSEKDYGQAGNLGKNILAIGAKMTHSHEAGINFPTLEKLIDTVIEHAKEQAG